MSVSIYPIELVQIYQRIFRPFLRGLRPRGGLYGDGKTAVVSPPNNRERKKGSVIIRIILDMQTDSIYKYKE